MAALCFNPRTREGATKRIVEMAENFGFNPRTREGATHLICAIKQLKMVSIHAPVKVRR